MTKLKIILPLVLLLVIAGYWGLNQDMFSSGWDGEKRQSQRNESQYKKPQVDEESSNESGEEGEINRNSTGKQEDSSTQQKDGKTKDENAGVVTVEDIKEKYEPKFMALKKEYDAKINNLINQAISEYRSYKEKGEDPPLLKLANKYRKEGQRLEEECDKKFYALLDQMEKELKENDLPLTVLEKAEKEYESRKEQRREKLLEKGLDFLGL